MSKGTERKQINATDVPLQYPDKRMRPFQPLGIVGNMETALENLYRLKGRDKLNVAVSGVSGYETTIAIAQSYYIPVVPAKSH